ncbi:FRG domain-containing protein [Sorangium sp. So ce394]|uniref:FRG domain-containing protein n=1 Tax=Sorangium sp. So ce394 TaxID=3133310 RepID=UPI003F5BB805
MVADAFSDSWYQEWRCDTAEDFLAHLSPLHRVWGSPNPRQQRDPRQWLFRGQSNADWGLVPSILRPGAVPQVHDAANATARRRFELNSLRRFLRMADEQGLPWPEDNQRVRDVEALYALDGYEEISTHSWRFDDPWPPLELLSHFALAQHYGIPTQLLDWSRRPLVAAYFAAIEAAKNPGRFAQLAVFGIAEPAIIQFCTRTWGPEHPQGLVVTAPYATNPNLRAQYGAFTVVRVRGEEAPPTIDQVLFQAYDAERRSGGAAPMFFYYPFMQKIVLPTKEAPRLLRLLAYHRIHAASLFPGYAGVAQAITESQLWDQPPGDYPFVLS